MKFFTALTAFVAVLATASPVPDADANMEASTIDKRQTALTLGLDIDYTSGPGIPWPSLWKKYFFAYIQTTYGMSVTNTWWPTQKNDARAVGFVTGGVHHPNPAVATAADQAKFFSAFGGDWVLDKMTMPGALYLGKNEHNKTVTCYNLSTGAWVKWITEFLVTYQAINTRYPLIFTDYDWWKQCTGAYPGFAGKIELWVNNHSGTYNPLPIAWTNWTVWQFGTSGAWDDDYYQGTLTDLHNWVL